MRTFILPLFLLIGLVGYSQGDIPTTKPLKIGPNNNLDVKTSNVGGTVLRMPSMFDQDQFKPDESPNIQMLPERKLVQAGHDMKVQPKFLAKKEKESTQFFGDQYLGDFKTTAAFVGVVARDHEYVDGDRVKIYLNGEVVEYNMMLSGSFKGVNVDLKPGFNRIDFEALNQGSSGPNTAQIVVTDNDGNVLHNNRWNLSTGSKASLVVVKEEEKEETGF
ncbi:hypothetical protein [Croceivirga thetidis]|uniref:Secreted protein n=1 Tax=Croceivirga thetidis TaxID=2721623 RepID=A0ABX1GNW4_9FLAO|nr:hypothetical protein [Croceivirga thetidis]NKI31610.1 hypothetical protein [Croceivirga thetidis]